MAAIKQLCYALINGNIKSDINVSEGDFDGAIDVVVKFPNGSIYASGYGDINNPDFSLVSAEITWNGGSVEIDENNPDAENVSKCITLLRKGMRDINEAKAKKVKKITEAQLRKMITECVKNILKEDKEFYPEKLLFYPENGSLAGDMGYEFVDKGSLGADNPETILNGIVEYFTDDYPWEKEEMYDDCAVVYYTGNPQKLYISSLDSEYKNDIAKAAAKEFGAEIPVEVVGSNLSESKINKIVAESIKKVLNKQ